MHMKKLELSTEDRAFCTLVAKASLVNHFSAERERLDREIAAGPPSLSLDEVRERSQARVRAFVESLERGQRADVHSYVDSDVDILKYTVLFDLFNQIVIDFLGRIVPRETGSAKIFELSITKVDCFRHIIDCLIDYSVCSDETCDGIITPPPSNELFPCLHIDTIITG